MAIGQLVLGPLSDATGRRRLLVGATFAFAVFAALGAVAPGPALLLTARIGQGFAGGCGLSVGRAVISDRWTGADAAVAYGTLTTFTLLGPIIAPPIGGLVLLRGDWRDVFWFMAALGLVTSIGVFFGIGETLPVERRHPPGLGATGRRMATLLRNRTFRTALLVQCLATAGFFTYIGGSSFVLQE